MASRSLVPASRPRQTTSLPALVYSLRLMAPLRLMDSLFFEGADARNGNGGDLLVPPRMNIEDRGSEVRITIELPGVADIDVEVTLDDDILMIAGEKRQEAEIDEGGLRLVERAFGRFSRAVQLPFHPDPNELDAQSKDGVLTITVPKNAEQRKRQRRIAVKRDPALSGGGSHSGTSASSGSQATESSSTQGQDARDETAEADA